MITFRDELQEKLYNKIKEFIDSEKRSLLISGPPGSGKTFITIHSLIDNFNGKIVVILRTHSQQDHYKKLFGDDFLSIRGIEYHCQIPQVKMHPLRNQLCKWMRLGKHTACRGCQYRLQFMEIPKYKVISFLYSHNAELIQNILKNIDNYVLVFDEYHHVLPKEQTISKYFIQLASAEYGEELDLNKDSFIEERIKEMKEIGERNWRKVGYSYLLQLVEIIEYLKNKNRWFYRVEDGYAYLDDSIYSLVNNNAKNIFISATPLPEIQGLLNYDSKFNMNYELKNIIFAVYKGFKFSFNERGDEKTIKHIRKLLYCLSKYKSVVFFPSSSALKSVFPRLPEGFTLKVEEFPEKNTLLIAGGKFSEGIDLPKDIEIITIIGIPYDDPLFRNPYLRELFRYFKFTINTRKILYQYRALLKTIQSFGRGIRDIKQKLIVVLADKRYADEQWLELFPEWLKFNISKFEFFNKIEELDEFILHSLLFNNEEALRWLENERWRDYREESEQSI